MVVDVVINRVRSRVGCGNFELIAGRRDEPEKTSLFVTSPDCTVGIATGLNPGGGHVILLFCNSFRPALGPTQPRGQWVKEFFP